VILLDAYALVALLATEPAGTEVDGLLESGQTAVTAVNLAEAIDITERVHQLERHEIRDALAPLLGPVVLVLPHDERDAWRAAELRAAHYERTERAVSIADCFLLAAATPDDSIATSDPAVAATARDEGIRLIALPDSSGVRP